MATNYKARPNQVANMHEGLRLELHCLHRRFQIQCAFESSESGDQNHQIDPNCLTIFLVNWGSPRWPQRNRVWQRRGSQRFLSTHFRCSAPRSPRCGWRPWGLSIMTQVNGVYSDVVLLCHFLFHFYFTFII